MNIEQESKVQ